MGSLGLALIAGALTTLNPCVFPILPLVAGSALEGHRAAPLLMGIGMAFAFALLGLASGLLAGASGFDQDTVRQVSALLMIVFGMAMVLPQGKGVFARILSPVADRASALGTRVDAAVPSRVGSAARAVVMGMLLGFVWTPCSGPLLASTLALAASDGAVSATITLAVFGLGAATPLVLVGHLSRATMGRLRGWILTHGDTAQRVMGGLLALVGLLVLLGADKILESKLLGLLPSSWLGLTTRF